MCDLCVEMQEKRKLLCGPMEAQIQKQKLSFLWHQEPAGSNQNAGGKPWNSQYCICLMAAADFVFFATVRGGQRGKSVDRRCDFLFGMGNRIFGEDYIKDRVNHNVYEQYYDRTFLIATIACPDLGSGLLAQMSGKLKGREMQRSFMLELWRAHIHEYSQKSSLRPEILNYYSEDPLIYR